MHTSPSRVATLLPKNWPRRVRSALVHAISMSNVVFAVTRGHGENHFNARVRIQAANDRLRRDVALLKEELRIKDARMDRIPPQRRPHYPPMERLAILELRAARAWSLAETARRLLVTPLTVASWTKRLDDEGPDALVRLEEPVNRFPDFVRYLVRRLKVLCPSMGRGASPASSLVPDCTSARRPSAACCGRQGSPNLVRFVAINCVS